jgi:uncharacterized protein
MLKLPALFAFVTAVLALSTSNLQAAPALSSRLQSQLDIAVIEYSSEHFDKARVAFEALARRHVAAAEFNLAVMHIKGQLPKPNLTTARQLLARALENAELGPRDLVAAHRWYQAAAEGGDGESQLAMGTAHYLGRGVKKDPARAANWFREAAKGGDVGAQYLLASMYEQGDGVDLDLRLARYWYDVAAKNGDPAAPGKLKEIDAKINSAPA